jgi:hypothetical protein
LHFIPSSSIIRNSEEKGPFTFVWAWMTDAMFFLSAKIKELHFYRLIVEISSGIVLDAEAFMCDAVDAVIEGGYAVDPFRVHPISSQAGRGDNPYTISAILI